MLLEWQPRCFAGSRRCRTALLLACLLALSSLQSASYSVKAFSIDSRRQQQLQHLFNADQHDEEETYDGLGYTRNTAAKRDGGKGTCTCTCETKPAATSHQSASAAEHSPTSGIQTPARGEQSRIPPESASLIRTAARMESTQHRAQQAAESRARTDAKANTAAAAAAQNGGTRTSGVGQIVRVPPLTDAVAHVDDDSGQEDLDETNNGQGHESSDQWGAVLSSGQDSWGHGSRYPWKRLPDTMCYREACQADKDCCLRFNLCDKSAHVCVDCWYGSTCTSERDCCLKYPYCQREWKTSPVDGQTYVAGGKCVNEM